MRRVVPAAACNYRSLVSAQASQINRNVPRRGPNARAHPTTMVRFIVTRRPAIDARHSMIIKLGVANLWVDQILDR
eukprot:2161663-Prymnesium_polylepis.1